MDYYKTLDVLKSCSIEELQPLVDLIKSEITSSFYFYESYNQNKDNPKLLADAIYSEIREFGGNTFANIFRGEGVPYIEVVQDVAKKLKVDKASSDLIELERQVLAKVLELAFEKLSEKERREIFSELDKKNFDPSMLSTLSTLRGSAITAILTTSPFLMHQLANNLLIFGTITAAKKVAAFAGGRVLSILAGPVGWVIGGAWTVFDIASPATRVTLPCVVHIAAIRLTKMNEENNNKYGKYK